LWLGVAAYGVAQMAVASLGVAWGGAGQGAYGFFLLLSVGGLVLAGYRPLGLRHPALRYPWLALGWLVLLVAAAVAWREPYVFVRESQWLGPSSYRGALHPLLPVCLGVLLFLTALAHVARPGSRLGRVVLLDAPLLALGALVLVLHLRGYPEFMG
jgi:hypothetical protein